ncbi:hypothetical protein A4A49_29712 [Nicotiana attenuata]|uniref:Uncharacterized protein n=1 Tax=Nicotiana attenuata TaxID=49451 RepID=A0A314KNT3_NICAT|nr:hypothetical protein A4A49_29712 [Nicotiana attenuata]
MKTPISTSKAAAKNTATLLLKPAQPDAAKTSRKSSETVSFAQNTAIPRLSRRGCPFEFVGEFELLRRSCRLRFPVTGFVCCRRSGTCFWLVFLPFCCSSQKFCSPCLMSRLVKFSCLN